jgi:hypothetical protein
MNKTHLKILKAITDYLETTEIPLVVETMPGFFEFGNGNGCIAVEFWDNSFPSFEIIVELPELGCFVMDIRRENKREYDKLLAVLREKVEESR